MRRLRFFYSVQISLTVRLGNGGGGTEACAWELASFRVLLHYESLRGVATTYDYGKTDMGCQNISVWCGLPISLEQQATSTPVWPAFQHQRRKRVRPVKVEISCSRLTSVCGTQNFVRIEPRIHIYNINRCFFLSPFLV